jgi:antirestriction protein ArdC
MKNQKVYEKITDLITAKLEQGDIPWRKPWSTNGCAQVGDCKSLISHKPYRGINALLTAMSGYSSPYWLTYKQAIELGANVRRGEKATPIIFWNWIEKDKQGKDKDKKDVIPFIKQYSIFNVEQIEGLKIEPKKLGIGVEKKIDFKPIEKAESIVKAYADGPDIRSVEQRAYYAPSADLVNMPKKESFSSVEEYYAVLFHELGHSTGHARRLNRNSLTQVNLFGSHDYSKEELVAEMTAAFLCGVSAISSDSLLDNRAAYIQNWLKVLRNNTKWLVEAAQSAQKAADLIQGIKPEKKGGEK